MDRKTAAQKLLEIADAIDKEAAESSYFVCASCNHTASLASINARRAKAAAAEGIPDVEPVTVNEVIGCPACQGDMRYVPTEMSERFYVEAAEGDDPLAVPAGAVEETPVPAPEGQGVPKPPKKKPEGDEDDSGGEIFKPVDEQKEEMAEPDEEEEINLDYEGDGEEDESAPGDGDEEAPEEVSEEVSEEAEGEVEEPKKKPKKKDKPDDGKPSLPKDQTPKFEFPKKASADIDDLAKKYL